MFLYDLCWISAFEISATFKFPFYTANLLIFCLKLNHILNCSYYYFNTWIIESKKRKKKTLFGVYRTRIIPSHWMKENIYFALIKWLNVMNNNIICIKVKKLTSKNLILKWRIKKTWQRRKTGEWGTVFRPRVEKCGWLGLWDDFSWWINLFLYHCRCPKFFSNEWSIFWGFISLR